MLPGRVRRRLNPYRSKPASFRGYQTWAPVSRLLLLEVRQMEQQALQKLYRIMSREFGEVRPEDRESRPD